MKPRFILLLLCFALPIVASLSSCEKDPQAPAPGSTSGAATLVAEVTSITEDYRASLPPSSGHRGALPPTLGADIKGVVRGYLEGHVISTGPHSGFTLYGPAAALLEGIAASRLAAGGGGGGRLQGGDHTGRMSPTAGPQLRRSVTGNPNNPQERVGELHYQLMDQLTATPTAFLTSTGDLDYPAYFDLVLDRLVLDGMVAEADRSVFPLAAMQARQPEYQGNESLVAFSNRMSSPLYTPAVRTVMAQYLGATTASRNAHDFGQYSISVEDLVVASSLSANEKALLLGVMATARHGAAYWD